MIFSIRFENTFLTGFSLFAFVSFRQSIVGKWTQNSNKNDLFNSEAEYVLSDTGGWLVDSRSSVFVLHLLLFFYGAGAYLPCLTCTVTAHAARHTYSTFSAWAKHLGWCNSPSLGFWARNFISSSHYIYYY